MLRFWYSVKIKGAGGWAHELVSAPFGQQESSFCPDPGCDQRADADH
jgi:hypothetical protein